jgi:hypothetical protein
MRPHGLQAFRIDAHWRFDVETVEGWRKAGWTRTIPPV